MVRICLTFALLFGCFAFNAQTNLELLETRIVDLQQQMASCRNDEAMSAYDDSLRTTIIDVMNSDGAFDYPFSKVKSMSILKPNDESFRLFNWNIPKMDQTHGYHCFMLQVTDAKNGIYNWVEFMDKTDFNASVGNKYLTPEKWQGALYYKIIELKKGKKTYYTLLGWDGADALVSRKVIEVLQFNGGKIRFGAPIFKMDKGSPKRFELVYADEVMTSLKFDPKEKRIVFDHLAARTPGLEGNPAFMGPDLSFDAFVMEKGKWVYESDIEVTLGRDFSKKPFIDPRN